MLTIIRGAGDIASGVALRLYQSGFSVIMTDLARPTAIRRTVCLSEALRLGEAQVEDVFGKAADSPQEALHLLRERVIPVLADAEGACIPVLRPDAVVDAILAKRNMGTNKDMAPVVVALGPGFTAGIDCHAVVETMRGHDLGRVLYAGAAAPNTGRPGSIGGYTLERILRSPAEGMFHPLREIGDRAAPGETVALVGGAPVTARIGGIIRGLLPEGTPVFPNMKSGDIDPRGERDYCYRVSDKARAVGGGVLEAILALSGALKAGAK